MILDIFGNPNATNSQGLGLLFNLIARRITEAHIQDRVKFDIQHIDKLPKAFTEAVKKAKDANFLKDSDLVVAFEEINSPAPASDAQQDQTGSQDGNDNDQGQEQQNQDNGDHGRNDGQNTDQNADQNGGDNGNSDANQNQDDNNNQDDNKEDKNDNQGTEDKNDDDEKKEKKVNESVKVQDLTGTVETIKTKKTCESGSKTENTNTAEKSVDGENDGSDDKKKEVQAPEKKLSEAATTAQGADLKAKIVDTLQKCLYIPESDPVELVDIPDLKPGTNVYFTKISIKNDGSKKDAVQESSRLQPSNDENLKKLLMRFAALDYICNTDTFDARPIDDLYFQTVSDLRDQIIKKFDPKLTDRIDAKQEEIQDSIEEDGWDGFNIDRYIFDSGNEMK